jgi:hypothetical protein
MALLFAVALWLWMPLLFAGTEGCSLLLSAVMHASQCRSGLYYGPPTGSHCTTMQYLDCHSVLVNINVRDLRQTGATLQAQQGRVIISAIPHKEAHVLCTQHIKHNAMSAWIPSQPELAFVTVRLTE